MSVFKIKSYAKINLALNVIGKNAKLHKVESLISFINLHDLISFVSFLSDPPREGSSGVLPIIQK